MKRTTIILPDDLAARLDRERRRQDTSVSAVVRAALDAYLTKPKKLGFVGIFDAPDDNIAARVEEILDAEYADWIWEDSGLARTHEEHEQKPYDAHEGLIVSEADASNP